MLWREGGGESRAGEETADALEYHRGGAEDAQHVCGRGLGACDAGDDDVSAGRHQ